MAITTVVTFKIDQEQGLRLAGQAAPILKRHGASAVRVGLCHSGAHAGTISVIAIFPDWQAYGKAMQGMYEDHAYRTLIAEANKVGQLLDRAIMVVHDL